MQNFVLILKLLDIHTNKNVYNIIKCIDNNDIIIKWYIINNYHII